MILCTKVCDACGTVYECNINYEQSVRVQKKCYDGSMIIYDLCDWCYNKLLELLRDDGEQD